MILPPINEADLISENAAPAPDVFEGVPDAVHPRLKLLNPSKAREIDQAFTKFQYEPDRRALAPGDFDFFSLPGKYRKIEHLLVIRSQPPDEVSTWLETRLPANPRDEQNQWLVSARADLSFVVERVLFIAHWDQLCALAHDAAFIAPPDESWLLVWEHQGFLTMYRRNPPAET